MESCRSEIAELVKQGYQPRVIWNLLSRRYPSLAGSESAVWRLAKSIRAGNPPEVVLRVETAPSEVAQVDFGYIGYLLDPDTSKRRKAWAFLMTLAWSRHQYAEIVFDQTIATWLVCHQHALRQAQGRLFEFFGGTPQRVALDRFA